MSGSGQRREERLQRVLQRASNAALRVACKEFGAFMGLRGVSCDRLVTVKTRFGRPRLVRAWAVADPVVPIHELDEFGRLPVMVEREGEGLCVSEVGSLHYAGMPARASLGNTREWDALLGDYGLSPTKFRRLLLDRMHAVAKRDGKAAKKRERRAQKERDRQALADLWAPLLDPDAAISPQLNTAAGNVCERGRANPTKEKPKAEGGLESSAAKRLAGPPPRTWVVVAIVLGTTGFIGPIIVRAVVSASAGGSEPRLFPFESITLGAAALWLTAVYKRRQARTSVRAWSKRAILVGATLGLCALAAGLGQLGMAIT